MKTKELQMYGREVKVSVLRDGGATPIKNLSAQNIYNYYLNFIQKADWFDIDKECFVALMLDCLGQIKSFVLISLGDLNQTICHPREVFKPAIVNSAHAIIILHNHPSGNPLPSQEDRAMTKIIMDAGKLLLIPVFDHVIAGDKGRFYSFKESQLQASAV